MYRFQTKDWRVFFTYYSPREISETDWQCFDVYDTDGDSFVVSTANVDFTSFEYLKNF
jgi:hypothetical protein